MKAWRRFVAMLSQQEGGASLALFRICIGLCVLYTFGLVLALDLPTLLWVDKAMGGYRSLGDGPLLVSWLGGPQPTVVHALLAGTLAAGLALTLGVGSRVAAFVALQGTLALTWTNGHAGGSYDDLLTNALWLLVLARSDATLSLSCRLRTGAWTSAQQVSSWPRWLAVLQLVVMYASTGSQKLSAHWLPGGDLAALYYILQQPSWQRWDMRWIAGFFPLTQAATLLTWLWEISSPLVLLGFWARRVPAAAVGWRGRVAPLLRRFDPRLLLCAVGIPMHLTTLVLMEVGPFSLISLSYYWCLFHPDELQRLLGRLRRGQAPPQPGTATPSPPAG